MKKIETFKHEYNLITTLVATWKDFSCATFKAEKHTPDFNNSISFYKLVEQFNKIYIMFENEYDNLSYLGINPISFLEFNEYKDCKILELIIESPDNNEEKLLKLIEIDGKVTYSVMEDNLYVIDETLTKKIKLDTNVIKSYIFLVHKYQLLFDAYINLKNAFIYGDGTTTLFTTIDGGIFDKLSNFKISCGNLFFKSNDYVEANFQLGNELKIILDEKKIIIDNVNIDDNEIFTNLIKELYIHRSKLPNMYKHENEKKLVKEFKL